ncbi:hypothetical protein HanXRQr2_Chr13g0619621 [Helianthus annuus]|uniref:Uncharacterized protein n=1 Tax=Helianthus annuus TaxID=4232 RepID=A0A9K3EN88_HELAN|nr:hypothetical protein HanXRQr2_Chr13g0619621 [Helianthus annuus]KAJ0851677.1 hypothetical protein HanPSC8_Chr13g0594821 [Helianthus annuus]
MVICVPFNILANGRRSPQVHWLCLSTQLNDQRHAKIAAIFSFGVCKVFKPVSYMGI